MKRKSIYLIASTLIIIGVSIVSALPENVTCTKYGMPINKYICSDKMVFSTEIAMIEYYTPELIEKQPSYTFVTGETTETFSGN